MRYAIYDTREGKKLGEVAWNNGSIEYSSDCVNELKNFIADSIRERQIHAFRDIHDLKENTSAIIAAPIDISDPLFPLALRDFLLAHGYDVRERIEEEEEEIRKSLEFFPDSEEKQDMLKRLPDMTRLEKTFILEKLKEYPETSE